jgi:hypothetical protein
MHDVRLPFTELYAIPQILRCVRTSSLQRTNVPVNTAICTPCRFRCDGWPRYGWDPLELLCIGISR